MCLEDKITDGIASVTAMQANAAIVVAPVKALLTETGTVEAIQSHIHLLSEGIPVLMNALDKVATIHPFIGGPFHVISINSRYHA